MKVDFDDLAPEARRIVLVASDEKYSQLTRQIDWRKVAKLAAVPLVGVPLGTVSAVLGPAAAGSAYLATTWTTPMSTRRSASPMSTDRRAASPMSMARGLVARFTQQGEIPIPHLAADEAARRFSFDFGEPKDGSAYILDPCVPGHYLVPSIANERLAQEKMSAFTQIAATLGAKRVEIVSGEATTAGGTGTGEMPVRSAAGQIGIAVELGADHAVKRQIYMEFDAPERAPFVPPELARWAELDPSLRALVGSRMHARARTARLRLTFDDMLDVDGSVTADLARRRIGVGGKYKRVRASSFSFEIEFWPARRDG